MDELIPNNLIKVFELMITYLNKDGDFSKADVANFKDTPIRAAKAILGFLKTKSELITEIAGIIETSFPLENDNFDGQAGMITQGPISVDSLCPHHFLNVRYEAYLSYIPIKGGQVLGLSKLARVAKILGGRPVLQEQLAADICDVLYKRDNSFWPSFTTSGSAVQLIGSHSCMSCRGVKDQALTLVTELRGGYWENNLEDRFYQSIESISRSKLLR